MVDTENEASTFQFQIYIFLNAGFQLHCSVPLSGEGD